MPVWPQHLKSGQLVGPGTRASEHPAVNDEIFLTDGSASKETLQDLRRASGLARLRGDRR